MSALSPVQSPLLATSPGVRHAFFTREGGVSTGVWAGLNVGRGSKDDPAAVEQNRARAAAWFDRPEEALFTAYQIHSAVALAAPWEGRPEGDAVVTAEAGVVCGTLAADCAPVLLADPVARVVGVAHAGWKGALGGVVEVAVMAMVARGAEAARIVAAVGPCIGPASYEVGEDFRATFLARDPESAACFAPEHAPGRRRFDLPRYVLSRLARAGVTRAEWTGHDTYADPQRFFSNRRALHEGARDYGRLLSAIMLG